MDSHNNLDMLEQLLQHEISGPQSSLTTDSNLNQMLASDLDLNMTGLPSEPNVIRTKRMGHRKAQSNSFVFPGKNLDAQISHKRTSSTSGLSDVETSDFQLPFSNLSPYQLPVHPLSGHRRFHSVGSPSQNEMSYQFPQSGNESSPTLSFSNGVASPSFAGNMSYSFPSHQKSLSGTTEMFNDFLVMKLEKEAPNEDGKTRLHPLGQDSFVQPDTLFTPENSQYNGINPPKDDMYYKEENDYGTGDSYDFNRVITQCSWGACQLEHQTQDALVAHILQDHVGTGKASYICEWAGCSRMFKPFSKRHKIQNHIRIHTGEKPFVCPVSECGKKFSRQDGLNTHIKTHSSVKPFVCLFPNCGKAYFHSRSLRKHERAHTDPETGKAFVSELPDQEDLNYENKTSYYTGYEQQQDYYFQNGQNEFDMQQSLYPVASQEFPAIDAHYSLDTPANPPQQYWGESL